MYSLVLIYYLAVPQTIVALKSGLSWEVCSQLKSEWVVPNQQAKLNCQKVGSL